MELPNKPLMEISEVLPFFGVVENTFRSWIRRKNLPKDLILKVGASTWIRTKVLAEYLSGELAI